MTTATATAKTQGYDLRALAKMRDEVQSLDRTVGEIEAAINAARERAAAAFATGDLEGIKAAWTERRSLETRRDRTQAEQLKRQPRSNGEWLAPFETEWRDLALAVAPLSTGVRQPHVTGLVTFVDRTAIARRLVDVAGALDPECPAIWR